MSLGSPRFCWYSSCVRRDYSDEAARSRLMPQTPLSVSHPAVRRGVNAGPWSLGWVLVVLAVLAFYPVVFGNFLTLGVTIVLFAGMATAWDVLGGWTGQLSLGHADRKSTRLNSSHEWISYAVFCLKKKNSMLVPA